MIGALPIGHAAGANLLDRRAKDRIASHQVAPRLCITVWSER
jgi:hypothetical protein